MTRRPAPPPAHQPPPPPGSRLMPTTEHRQGLAVGEDAATHHRTTRDAD